MRQIALSGIVAIVLAGPAGAQSVLGAMYPSGLPLRPNSGMALSMGGAGVGVVSDHHVMLSNPANLGAIDKTVFSSQVGFDFLRIRQGDKQSSHLSMVPKQISVGFWLGRAGTAAFSLDTRTDARVKYLSREGTGGAASVNALELSYSSNGGLSVWQIGYGYNVKDLFQLGLCYERGYFSIDRTAIQETYGYSGAIRSRDSMFVQSRCNAIRGGVMVPVWRFNFGLTGEYFIPSDASSVSGIYWLSTQLALNNKSFKLQLPPSLTLGLSYRHSPRLLAAMDLGATFWNRFRSEGVLDQSSTAERAAHFAIGGQYHHAPKLLAPKYWETVRYRVGFRYDDMPAKENREVAFSLGAGLPLKASGLFDIVAEYGWRTSTGYDNYGEEFVNLSVGINAGRKWTGSAKGSY